MRIFDELALAAFTGTECCFLPLCLQGMSEVGINKCLHYLSWSHCTKSLYRESAISSGWQVLMDLRLFPGLRPVIVLMQVSTH